MSILVRQIAAQLFLYASIRFLPACSFIPSVLTRSSDTLFPITDLWRNQDIKSLTFSLIGKIFCGNTRFRRLVK